MKNKHVTRFGYPANPGGALYYVSDYEGLAQTAIDLERARLLANGFSLTTKDSDQLMAEIRAEHLAFVSAISAIGIPAGIRQLLEASKKSKAGTIARDLTVTEFDLFLLLKNQGQMGFEHRSKFPDYVPDHLAITDLDTLGIREGRLRKVSKKLNSLFIQRRHIHVHLLERDSEWHCIYFSYEDAESVAENHWKHGPHFHYVSHLWPNLAKEQIWRSFDKRKTEIPGNLHVRFVPFEFPESASQLGMHSEATGSLMFPSDLSRIPRSYPIPPA